MKLRRVKNLIGKKMRQETVGKTNFWIKVNYNKQSFSNLTACTMNTTAQNTQNVHITTHKSSNNYLSEMLKEQEIID